jgi:hypothetical protein
MKNSIHVSNVCRVEMSQELLDLAKPGITPIPETALQPRQVQLRQENGFREAKGVTLKWHRDAWVTVLPRHHAEALVEAGHATWREQRLLCYSMEDYLADNDVQADAEELAKAQAAADDGAEVVVVAVIGENRGTLTVCRNIVSGCQSMASLVDDAKAAIEAHSCFIVED